MYRLSLTGKPSRYKRNTARQWIREIGDDRYEGDPSEPRCEEAQWANHLHSIGKCGNNAGVPVLRTGHRINESGGGTQRAEVFRHVYETLPTAIRRWLMIGIEPRLDGVERDHQDISQTDEVPRMLD